MAGDKRKRIDRGGKGYDPSPYSNTDTREVTAVKIFEGLIDESIVKTHIDKRDKNPNTDGHIEPVDKEGRSLGKINVQVKALSDSDLKRRGHSCGKGFLGFCRQSTDPTLLIGVDTENRFVYWCEVTRDMVNDMEVQGSLTVRFPEQNIITDGVHDYYEPWANAVTSRARFFANYYPLDDAKSRIRVAKKVLEEELGGVPVDATVNVAKVQEFLEEYNRLMAGDFELLTNVFHPNARKFGFAYTMYEETRVMFSLFDIDKQSTDLDIKKIPSGVARKLMERGITLRGYFDKNPIEQEPRQLARMIIAEEIDTIVENGGIEMPDISLSQELIIDIMDKTHAKFGLEREDVYSVDKVRYGLQEFLPRWAINFLSMCPDSNRRTLERILNEKQYFDIGITEFGMYPDDLNKIYVHTHEQVAIGAPLDLYMPIGFDDHPMGHLPSSLEYLNNEGVRTVNRLYPAYDYAKHPNSHWICDQLSPADLLCKVKTFYDMFPKSYEHVVKANFPNLAMDIRYVRRYDRQVVIVRVLDQCLKRDDQPSMLVFNLKCVDEDHDIVIDVYEYGDGNAPQIDLFYGDKVIDLDGRHYQLVSGSDSNMSQFFRPHLMYDAVIGRLREELNGLFERWDEELTAKT